MTWVIQKALGVISLFAIVSCSSGTPDTGTPEVRAFITTWRVSEYDLEIRIPTCPIDTCPDETYNYTVAWGDGNIDENQTEDASHVYAEEGDYDVTITGDFPRIYFNRGEGRREIIAIKQWGPNPWSSMENAFAGCSQLEGQATDTPDLSNVESMSSMFRSAHIFDQDLSGWNVSNVKDMSSMFRATRMFNQALSGWDVSSVTDMSYMFRATRMFNQALSGWDVSSVTDMSSMFQNASSFNQNLGGWKIPSLRTAENMFAGVELSTENYDSILAGWSATAITGTDENKILFDGGRSAPGVASNRDSLTAKSWDITDNAVAFITTWTVTAGDTITIPICPIATCANITYSYQVDWGDESDDTTTYTGDAIHMYGNTEDTEYRISITGDFPRIRFSGNKIIAINQWGTISWSSMESAFESCSNLEVQATDTPDLSNAADGMDMSFMFVGASVFNQDIGDWDVSNVTNMEEMFYEAYLFNQDIGDWNVSNVTNMASMFYDAEVFNQDIGDWDVSNVTDMSYMFSEAYLFNGDIGDWDVPNVTNMEDMFSNAEVFNQDIGDWNVSNVTNMEDMFSDTEVFNQDIGDWNVSNVTDMRYMFDGAEVFNQDLSSWNVCSVMDVDPANLLADFAMGATNFQDKSKYPDFADLGNNCPDS